MKHILENSTVLRSERQLNLLEMIRENPGVTFREIYSEMKNRPVNDAGVRMSLDRLEELKLVERTPPRKYGVRGRFSGGVVRWYPKTISSNGHVGG